MAKKKKNKYTTIGGQALMEGIMMRGPYKTVMCVRRSDGSIYTESVPQSKPGFIMKIPIIRGIASFISSMSLGTKMMMRSADIAIEDIEKDEAAKAAEAETTAVSPDAAETVENTAETIGEAVSETADTVTETAEAVTETVEAVSETVEEAAAETVEEAAAETVEEAAAETVEEAAAETVEEAVTDMAETITTAEPVSDEPKQETSPCNVSASAASANADRKAEGKVDKKAEKNSGNRDKKNDGEKNSEESGFLVFLATVLGFAFAILLFFYAPTYAGDGLLNHLIPWLMPDKAEYLATEAAQNLWRPIIEGVIKILIFIIYIAVCSCMKEIRTLFKYHGAEHKTIFCYEAGEELTVENVRKYKRFHPRCGTSFLILMLLVGVACGIAVKWLLPSEIVNSNIYYPLIKIALIPLIMGIGYELLKACGKHDNLLTRMIAAPGMWMQRLTTKEPTDEMIECAITALKPVIPENGEDMQ